MYKEQHIEDPGLLDALASLKTMFKIKWLSN